MSDAGRVITAKLPDELALEMDVVAERLDRSRSWIVRQAVSEWLMEEQRRHELTLEGLDDVDKGRVVSEEEMLKWARGLKERKKPKAAA